MVFTTDSLMTIDIGRRELKSIIGYNDIKELTQSEANKLKICFKREISGVRDLFFNFFLEKTYFNFFQLEYQQY